MERNDYNSTYDYRPLINTVAIQDERGAIWERGSKFDFLPLDHTKMLTLAKGESLVEDSSGAHLKNRGLRSYQDVVRQFEKEFGVGSGELRPL